MNYVSIMECSSRLVAETFGHALGEKGIPFIVKSDDLGIGGGAGGTFGATLWVPEELVNRARRVLPCIFPADGEGDEPVPDPAKV